MFFWVSHEYGFEPEYSEDINDAIEAIDKLIEERENEIYNKGKIK